MQRIDYTRPATVQIGNPPWPLIARPVGLVPRVDPLRHTADILYDLGKADAPRRASAPRSTPATRCSRRLLPLDRKRPESVVPASAVVNDYHGSAWVYLEVGGDDKGRVYERRRVEVGARVEAQGLVVRPPLRRTTRSSSPGPPPCSAASSTARPPAPKPGDEDE